MKKSGIRQAFKGRKVLVVGDLILDRFIYGGVRRISPEAPVPVVEVLDEKSALGGAANVANNIRALSGNPVLLGVIGGDMFGEEFLSALRKAKIDPGNVIKSAGTETIVKTRILAYHQQVVRVDREKKFAVAKGVQQKLRQRMEKLMGQADAVVVSDYAKGTFNREFLLWIGRKAREKKIPYIVDPKPVHFPYPGATIVTPNRGEAFGFLNRQFSPETMGDFAKEIISRAKWEAVLLTLGDEGMALYEKGERDMTLIPALMKEVYDVTGAGDTVVSTIALALASGFSFKDAAVLANAAASVVVSKLGTATCTMDELLETF